MADTLKGFLQSLAEKEQSSLETRRELLESLNGPASVAHSQAGIEDLKKGKYIAASAEGYKATFSAAKHQLEADTGAVLGGIKALATPAVTALKEGKAR